MTSASRVIGLLSGVLLLSVSHAGANPLTVTDSVGGAPVGADSYVNFDNLSLGDAGGTSGGLTVAFSPDAQAVQGSSSGLYAAPFISNSDGAQFGDSTVSGPDSTTYLTSGAETGSHPGASVTLIFPNAVNYMGLLWGSVDGYNTLSLYNGNTLVGTVTGSDVTNNPDGDQGVNGTYYVNISSTQSFTSAVATSSQYAFEFDNVAYSTRQLGGGGNLGTPLPAAMWLFGTVLAGSGLVMRRRRNGKPVSSMA